MNFLLEGYKWGTGQLGAGGGVVNWSFAITPGSIFVFDRFITNPAYQQLVRDAFQAWENVANIDFVEVAGGAQSSLRLGWDAIDGPDDTVAEAQSFIFQQPTASLGSINEAEIRFDTAENWSTSKTPIASMTSFYTTALHEIGHAIGLGHVNDPTTIMNATEVSSVLDLTPGDILGVQTMYGAKTGAPGSVPTGTSGTNDLFTATAGPDSFDGGGGVDTVALGIASKDATISLSKSGVVTITDRNGTGGADTLTNIEMAQFTDTTIDLTNFVDLTGLSSAQFSDLAKVYVAYFNRAADAKGLYFWADKLGEGMSMNEIAGNFALSAEANALYPDTANTQAFVTAVYDNVLGRTPDSAGFNFWKGHLDAGTQTPATFVLSIIGGAQGADITYLANKANLGVYFSATKGMSDVTDAQNVINIFGDQATSNTAAAKASVDGHYTDATAAGGGDSLFELVGIVADPFTGFIG